jgi:urate oxidase
VPATLSSSSYGKAAVRLVTVTRRGARHELRDLTIAAHLEGEFRAAHVDGDNRDVLPTDTMKNTVYALARAHTSSTVEELAAAMGQRLLASAPAATSATIDVEVHRWDRAAHGERGHDHAFIRGAPARRVAQARVTRDGEEFESGIVSLGLLKTTNSAFEGFLVDDFTTLRATSDRILATDVDARWRYATAPGSFDFAWRTVRDALVETFAEHASRSVQHTLYAMGTAAIDRCDDVVEVRLRMPNRHHLVVDLTPFGQENANEVFVATDAPYGVIEATVVRAS